MRKDDLVRMRQMIDASAEGMAFASESDRGALASDRMLILALVKEIEIVGEAASKVAAEFKEAHPHIPWQSIIGMCNRLIHSYFDVDLDTLCQTVPKDLPPLVQAFQELVAAH